MKIVILRRLDRYLLIVLGAALLIHYLRIFPGTIDSYILFILSVLATAPVILSAFASLKNRRISVDLLASIALVASLLTREWASAVFINLMLTSARLFGYYTEAKARAA